VDDIAIDPEDGIVETVADTIGSDVVRHLPDAAHAQRRQSRIIEFCGTPDIRDANASVVDHHAPFVYKSLSSIEVHLGKASKTRQTV
jgi:hypothetical protein